uniref:Uncharacterized protein n=1 Tax=Strongyloides papillosus TaxID=174720 RepID=A0A0N5BXS4_STREA
MAIKIYENSFLSFYKIFYKENSYVKKHKKFNNRLIYDKGYILLITKYEFIKYIIPMYLFAHLHILVRIPYKLTFILTIDLTFSHMSSGGTD